MKIDDYFIVIFSWVLLGLFIHGMGILFLTKENRTLLDSNIKRAKPRFLFGYNIITAPLQMQKISAGVSMCVIPLFYLLLILARIRVNLPLGLTAIMLGLNMIIENMILFEILKFKKSATNWEEVGYYRALLAVLLAGPPIIWYQVLIAVVNIIYFLDFIRLGILFLRLK